MDNMNSQHDSKVRTSYDVCGIKRLDEVHNATFMYNKRI